MRKWIITASVVLVLMVAGIYVRTWLPVLLPWVNANTGVLQGINSGIQVVLWAFAGLAFVLGLWRRAKKAVALPANTAFHQLPAPPADFIGRIKELSELLDVVKTGGVIISGLGGVGKTALVLKLAEQLKRDYPDAQFYVDLKGVSAEPLAPKEAMLRVIRAWHSATLPENEDELRGLYLSALQGKRVLLLMDNARNAQQITPLIPPLGCLLLVTSRQHFVLPGLREKNLEAFSFDDAQGLLRRIALRLRNEKKDEIAEIAHLCGYLALALRAVGSALQVKKNLRPADYIRRLVDVRQRLRLTETEAALQASYELLSEELQLRFRFLAVFPDTFDGDVAAAIWGMKPDDAQDRLSELLAYSLIDFDERMSCHRVHDLVRLFADQRLDTQERTTAQERHSGYYLNVLRAAQDLYFKGGEFVAKGLALFEAEWVNIQAGQAWAADHREESDTIAELCWRYPWTGTRWLGLRRPPRERIGWLEQAVAAARRLKRRDVEGELLGNLGIAWSDLGNYRSATEFYEQALHIARETGSRLREGEALGNLGTIHSSLGEYRRAIQFLEQALYIMIEIGDLEGWGGALCNLGNAFYGLGDYHRAIEYYEQHLPIARKIGDRRGEGTALGNLGSARYRLGEYRRAIEYHKQYLSIAREIGDRRGEGSALGSLGVSYERLREYHRAIEYHERHLQIAREISDPAEEGLAIFNLGIVYENTGDLRRAIEYYDQHLHIAREIGDHVGEGRALWRGALVLNELRERELALARGEAALKVYETIDSPDATIVRNALAEWRL